MSLINKMLQDLDARGGASAGALGQQDLKAVPARERDPRPMLLAGVAAGLILLVAGGWLGWRHLAQRAPAPALAPVVKLVVPAAPGAGEKPSAPPLAAATQQDTAAQAGAGEPPAPGAPSAPVRGRPPRPSAVAARARMGRLERPPAPERPGRISTGSVTSTVHELGPAQLAENTYRRALVGLQEGRVTEALADLERALEINPRHDAARQTLISLLLENRRPDEAIRQLRLALGIDPRQPGLAMVLARLQLERGGPALDTLLHSLPYATGSADYEAFLAGVLQREQRNGEAAEHYQAALRLAPQNAVWWMGLGISLQADKHMPEAREAFSRARAAGGLTPELQAFVERKLELLAR